MRNRAVFCAASSGDTSPADRHQPPPSGFAGWQGRLLVVVAFVLGMAATRALVPAAYFSACAPTQGFVGSILALLFLPRSAQSQPSYISSTFHITALRSPVCNTRDTSSTPDTGNSESSKIASKTALPIQIKQNERNYYFGVASENFFPAQTQGGKTRLSAHNTPLFWMAAAPLQSLSSSFDAPPMWCALTGRQTQINKAH